MSRKTDEYRFYKPGVTGSNPVPPTKDSQCIVQENPSITSGPILIGCQQSIKTKSERFPDTDKNTL